MKTFSIDLMILIQHIHTQYEKIQSNKSFENRMCYCRLQILEQFTIAVEKLLIKLGSRTLKFVEDFDIGRSEDISDLRDWFENDVYEKLYENLQVSNKMVLSFQLLQSYQDKKFFDIIQDKYENILICIKNQKETGIESEINELFEEIRAWYELFLYMILSTQFNCQSIKDSFLIDHNVPPDFSFHECADCPNQKTCLHHNDEKTCKVHETVLNGQENINIIMTNDFIDDMTWLEKLKCIVTGYHVDPGSIKFVLDYRMYDHLIQCKLSHHHYDKLLEANECFKDMHIINHEGINFNGYYEKLEHLIK